MTSARRTRPRRGEELAASAGERAGVYGLLAAAFRSPPSAEGLARLGESRLGTALSVAGVDLSAAPAEARAKELALEYARLFVGAGARIAPYESAHAQGGGGDRGKETGEVQDFIEAAGVALAPGGAGVVDHFGVELEFMQELARRESVAWRMGDAAAAYGFLQIQRRFLGEHLGKWAFTFCDEVRGAARGPFYRELAALASAFLAAEVEEVPRRQNAAVRLGGVRGRLRIPDPRRGNGS
ncbi:MAG: molecular chaperone TorD family protein [Proteobacteria bacterium]|nr:molecular chaperone TorD family protein [Pseudomonadota bacterium]